MPSRQIEEFIARWAAASPSERASAQLFLVELCDFLGVLRPDPNPPFLLVVDVGNSIEVFADFTQAGRNYLHFPHPQAFRIRLEDLRRPEIRERFRRVWTDPLALDPARHSASVTCGISDLLAKLAKSLEQAGHPPRRVADFLRRCLFCMFAKDAGLLPAGGFTGLLDSVRADPAQFAGSIPNTRREVRKPKSEVRMNNRCSKWR